MSDPISFNSPSTTSASSIKADANGSNRNEAAVAAEQEAQAPVTTEVSEKDTFAFMGNNPVTLANMHFVSKSDKGVANCIESTIFSDAIAGAVAASISGGVCTLDKSMSSSQMVAWAKEHLSESSIANIEKSIVVLTEEVG